VRIELEGMMIAQEAGESVHRPAIDFFHVAALTADRVMMVLDRTEDVG
jgi:hypothetical protein